MREIIYMLIGLVVIGAAIFIGCSKTIIRNEVEIVEEKEYIKPTRAGHRDSTQRDTTRHEISFSPVVIGWEIISGEDTIRVDL